VFEIAMILVMVGVLAVIAAPWIMRRQRAGADWQSGNLLVTGVSPPPVDLTGRQFATITGVINGPTVAEHVVYQRLEVDVNDWPTISQIFPVVYSPKNPDNWRFAPQEGPPPPTQRDYPQI
jgi:hypothetical protein